MKYIVRKADGSKKEFKNQAEAEDFCRQKWPEAVISNRWEAQGYIRNPVECLWVWKNAKDAEGPFGWGDDGAWACAIIYRKQ
jgi:hypothetical protein